MKSKEEIISRIKKIAQISKNFKIGKTGQSELERWTNYNFYDNISTIYESRNKEYINDLEAKMIEEFTKWENNDNDIGGSSGDMDKTGSYKLYVVYNKAKERL